MIASFSFITTVLIASALVIPNVVVSNDRLEHPMEVVILFESVARKGDAQSTNLFFTHTLAEFGANFFLDEKKVRLAVVRFNFEDSKVLQNLAPSWKQLWINATEWAQGSIMLHLALTDAETKIFKASRPEALKIVFVVLTSVHGLDLTNCETAARKLRDQQDVTIFVTVFTSDQKENVSLLYNIAGGRSNVNPVVWPPKKIFLLAGEVMVWLKGRIVEMIQLRPSSSSTSQPRRSSSSTSQPQRSSSSTSGSSTATRMSKIPGFTFSESDQPAPSQTDGMATWLIAVIFCSSFLGALIIIVTIATIVQNKRWKKVNKAFSETTANATISKESRQSMQKLSSGRLLVRPPDKGPSSKGSVTRSERSVKTQSKPMYIEVGSSSLKG